jgi:hypothetical protein
MLAPVALAFALPSRLVSPARWRCGFRILRRVRMVCALPHVAIQVGVEERVKFLLVNRLLYEEPAHQGIKDRTVLSEEFDRVLVGILDYLTNR